MHHYKGLVEEGVGEGGEAGWVFFFFFFLTPPPTTTLTGNHDFRFFVRSKVENMLEGGGGGWIFLWFYITFIYLFSRRWPPTGARSALLPRASFVSCKCRTTGSLPALVASRTRLTKHPLFLPGVCKKSVSNEIRQLKILDNCPRAWGLWIKETPRKQKSLRV